MISSLSFADSHDNSSVNIVTHCFHEHGIRVMSVPRTCAPAKGVVELPDVPVDVAIRIRLARVARRAGRLQRHVAMLAAATRSGRFDHAASGRPNDRRSA